jgi:predicted secreted protein
VQERLADGRSGRVAFVSHCLLNQNVRYLGGAVAPAAIDSVIDELRGRGVAIVQMPCPEQRAWGGVVKPWMLRTYGSRIGRSPRGNRLLSTVVGSWSRAVSRRLARRIAGEIRDYASAGYEVTDVIGVGPSPSCGVTTTVDVAGALSAMAHCDPAMIDVDVVNTTVVGANTVPGRGWFIEALVRRLDGYGLEVPVWQETLLAQPKGTPTGAPRARGQRAASGP